MLLAEVVHMVSGWPLAEFLERKVFGPLGLEMQMDPSAQLPGTAVSYTRVLGGGYEAVDLAWQQLGLGGIQTTPEELVRWADNYATGRLGGSTLRYAQLAEAAMTSGSGGERFGAGIFVDTEGGLYHDGEWAGFVTAFQVTADRRVAAAVACNDHEQTPSATARILTLIWA